MFGFPDVKVYVGVLQIILQVPGARSRKERRGPVKSISDRLRHKFAVSVNEIGPDLPRGQLALICTVAGNDPVLINSIIDKCCHLCTTSAGVIVVSMDKEVFRWQSKGGLDMTILDSEAWRDE